MLIQRFHRRPHDQTLLAVGLVPFVYVDQKGFEQHTPKTFQALTDGFTEYREAKA